MCQSRGEKSNEADSTEAQPGMCPWSQTGRKQHWNLQQNFCYYIASPKIESRESQFHGLAWEQKLFGSEPRWTLEPDIVAIKQTIQSLRPSSTVEVVFLVQGAFNKIYNVSIDDEPFIMRIALPVDPCYKVVSEVATMDWVRRITSLPIPRVITYQASRDNLIGFEWMLMTKMPGRPVRDILQSLSFDVKARLVRELAVSSARLFQN
ncbi:unnamed protein product [Penicillium glandicola]